MPSVNAPFGHYPTHNVSMDIYGCNITLINLNGLNKDDRKFYETVNDIITNCDNLHTIICGDWNLVLDVRIKTGL